MSKITRGINEPEEKNVANIIKNTPDEKPDGDKLTDDKLATAMKNIGKGVGKRTNSNVVGEHRRTVAEALVALDEMIKEKTEGEEIGLEIERDDWGRVRFSIVERKKGLNLSEEDLNLLNENPKAVKKILAKIKEKEIEEQKAIKERIKEADKKIEKKTIEDVNLQESVEIQDVFESNFSEAQIIGNTIRNVAIINKVSKNNRIYSDKALEDVAKLSDGIKVFCDHFSKDGDGKVRSVKDLIGRISSPRKTDGKVSGDLEVLENHKDWIFAIAKQMPEVAGMSILAKGRIHPERDSQGRAQVESVTQLVSIDLVSSPATTSSLFESK